MTIFSVTAHGHPHGIPPDHDGHKPYQRRRGYDDQVLMRESRRRATRILSLVVGGVICVAGVVGIVFGVRDQILAVSSSSWTGVEAEVVVSRVLAGSRRHGRAYYYPQLEYAYTVDGHGFVGTRISFGPVPSGGDAVPSQVFIARYPVGKRIQVFHDPVDPAQSVITPGPGGNDAGLTIIAGAFLAFGIAVIVLGRR